MSAGRGRRSRRGSSARPSRYGHSCLSPAGEGVHVGQGVAGRETGDEGDGVQQAGAVQQLPVVLVEVEQPGDGVGLHELAGRGVRWCGRQRRGPGGAGVRGGRVSIRAGALGRLRRGRGWCVGPDAATRAGTGQ
jgi:hypothetical protein